MTKICVFTGGRSDFDRLFRVCKEIENHPHCSAQLLAGSSHLSPEFGMSVNYIRQSGFPIAGEVEMLLSSESKVGTAKSVGMGTISLADSLSGLRPDLVLILGDRFELLSVICVCVCLNIPIAHIGGGQSTEGLIDEQIRHMITKASHLHFVANDFYGGRVRQMGEEPWRVFVTGSPSIDAIVNIKPLSKENLSEELGLDLNRTTILVTYHPTTLLDIETQQKENEEFFAALEEIDMQYILTYPNTDPGSQEIIRRLKQLAKNHNYPCVLSPSLGALKYISALHYVSLMLGNSSSGIVETPTFNLPVVNVGTRQQGRLMAENVINTANERNSIKNAVQAALQYDRNRECSKPYGNGLSSKTIVSNIVEMFDLRTKSELLQKKFYSDNGSSLKT